MGRSSIGVVTVDDHEAFRRSIRDGSRGDPGVPAPRRGGGVRRGRSQAVAKLFLPRALSSSTREMPGMDGFETVALRSKHPAATAILDLVRRRRWSV